ncbi:IS3 family transposase [Mycoplasmatota bacterium WC44]
MGVSRSGYYGWLKGKDSINRYKQNRIDLISLIVTVNKKHPSYGYRRIREYIFRDTGWIVSSWLVHSCCKELGIKSKSRKTYKKSGNERLDFPRLVTSWNASRPFEVVTSDTTVLKHKGKMKDLTLYIDVFNNEIVCYDLVKVNMVATIEATCLRYKSFSMKNQKEDIKTLRRFCTQIKGQYIPPEHSKKLIKIIT